jgi:tetratricopeptide (TPR) repeat protein
LPSPEYSGGRGHTAAIASERLGAIIRFGSKGEPLRNPVRSGFAFAAALSALCGATPALAQARCAMPIAQVYDAEGTVFIPGPPQIINIAAGSAFDVCAGETVATGARSRAGILLIATNQAIRIDQNTTVRIVEQTPQAPRSVIELLQGIIRLFNPIGRQLDVRTPFVTAGTEGTEFFVAYNPQTEETRAGVIEGLVRVTRAADSLLLSAGQAAIAPRVGPLQRLDIVPADAVRWSIFYPPASWTLPPAEEAALAGPVARAWQAWRSGNLQAFAMELNAVPQILPPPAPPPITDARSLLRFASLLLIVGQVEEAEAAIAQAELLYGRAALTPLVRPIAAVTGPASCRSLGAGWPLIPALRSIIAVARNQTNDALALSDCAVTAAREFNDPSATVAAAIARSYALQSAFRLPEARAILATVESANDPLVFARLAELDLSLGNNRAARLEAQRANQLAPALSLTSSILGYAALANYDFDAAQSAFARAAAQDPGDPLPHLGLGLVAIRSGNLFSFGSRNLEAGRAELVIAVALNPENAVARSYAGRTYAELRLYQDAFREWALAESADPNDPTAPLYRAFAERALNRPIEALRDIERSIALNDNRAVYRSRLLLDQDLATRTTDLASVYRDLGFDQLALSQAYQSLNDDPSNPGAHRFVSDTYLTMARHEIASDSELLQSLLLQPLNVQPLRPRLAREGLGIIELNGPFRVGYNEFSPLFASNGLSLLADAFGGNRGTYGENLVLSGIYDNVSFSAGQFFYETNGVQPINIGQFFENPDDIQPINRLRRHVENAVVQVALSDRASVLAEFRHSAYRAGQNNYYFAPLYLSDTLWEERDLSHYRVGGRFDITPAVTLVGVWTREHLTFEQAEPIAFYLDHETLNGDLGEAALYLSMPRFNVVAGAGHFDGNRKTYNIWYDILTPGADAPATHTTAWIYINGEPLTNVHVTVGASFDSRRSDELGDQDRINPKVGVSWDITSGITFRAAYVEGLKRLLVGGQTIEPTQIAGFNQLYDDPSLAVTKRWGAGFDFKLTNQLFAGIEWSERRLTELYVDSNEQTVRSYFNWTINDRFAFGTGLQWDRIDGDPWLISQFDDMSIIRIPAEIRYYGPAGFFALLGGAFVYESGHFYDPFYTPYKDHESFAVVNAGVGWRVPGRGAVASLQVTNLFNSSFQFQDLDLKNPGFFPHRMILGRLTFSF